MRLSTNWRGKDWASLRYAPWRAVIHNSKATLDAYNVQKTGPICCLTPQIWGDPLFLNSLSIRSIRSKRQYDNRGIINTKTFVKGWKAQRARSATALR